jgi:hypothetical protein
MSILFQKDWKDDKGNLKAIPHITTKNTSFLRTAQLLKRMGVKNYAFMLALYDPDLKNVDVYDLEEDTPENEILRTKVMIESRRNAWYWHRECIRIYEQGGTPIPFRLDRSSCAMTWCFLNGIDYTAMVPRQLGKAQRLDSLIQTPKGWKRMGDMQVGDKVVIPDGGTSDVVGVYPQGKKPIYRVYFEDGRWTDCCDDHLWKVYNRYWTPEDNQWRVITLREIMNRMEKHPSTEAGLFVPLVQPEIKEDVDLPLDPYVVGALIGDGGLTNGARISSKDNFILDELRRLLPTDVELVYDSGVDWRIVDRSRTPAGRFSPFLQTIRSLNLDKLSYEKTIPVQYMEGSTAQKIALLQGLMDTDGTVDGASEIKGGSPSFCTTSLNLAHQVQYLVRSLGGVCRIKDKKTCYTHNGEKREGRTAYILRIKIDNPKSLFRLPRKLDKISDCYKFAGKLKLGIKAVESIGEWEAQCIEVDHPDHLYITDDFIVTHNTVCALSLLSWILYSSGSEFTIGGFNKDDNLRRENVKRVKSFGENLPKWWLIADRYKDKANAEEIYYAQLKTHYVTFVAQKEKAAADKQARGASLPVTHWDEAEFFSNVGTSYPIAMASTGTARENAKKNGKPHSNILTTTAGDPSTIECKEAMAILDGAMPFAESLYDVENNEKLHQIVEASSPQKMILGQFSHLQLGKDNNWLREKIRRNRMTPEQTMRDYLNRRVSIADKPIISKEVLATINRSQEEVDHIQFLHEGFVIYWYLSKEVVSSQQFRDRPIVVGCDSSEMIDRDATTLVGIDPRSLETVFTFRTTVGNINVVGAMINKLLLMFPKMIWVPENKSSGTSLIDIVSLGLRKASHNPFIRIYNRVVSERHEQEFANVDIRDMSLLDTSVKRFFGFKTDKAKRDQLYGSTLMEATSQAASRVKDQTLIQELNTLTLRNNRVDHAAGGNDDTVIAWLLAMWFILHGKHLDLYGIKPGTVLSYITPGQPNKSKLSEEHQLKVRGKIEELEKALKLQRDPSLRKLIESDLTLVRQMVNHEDLPTPVTADEFNRDPARFTDQDIAAQSRTPVERDTVERSLKMLLNV